MFLRTLLARILFQNKRFWKCGNELPIVLIWRFWALGSQWWMLQSIWGNLLFSHKKIPSKEGTNSVKPSSFLTQELWTQCLSKTSTQILKDCEETFWEGSALKAAKDSVLHEAEMNNESILVLQTRAHWKSVNSSSAGWCACNLGQFPARFTQHALEIGKWERQCVNTPRGCGILCQRMRRKEWMNSSSLAGTDPGFRGAKNLYSPELEIDSEVPALYSRPTNILCGFCGFGKHVGTEASIASKARPRGPGQAAAILSLALFSNNGGVLQCKIFNGTSMWSLAQHPIFESRVPLRNILDPHRILPARAPDCHAVGVVIDSLIPSWEPLMGICDEWLFHPVELPPVTPAQWRCSHPACGSAHHHDVQSECISEYPRLCPFGTRYLKRSQILLSRLRSMKTPLAFLSGVRSGGLGNRSPGPWPSIVSMCVFTLSVENSQKGSLKRKKVGPQGLIISKILRHSSGTVGLGWCFWKSFYAAALRMESSVWIGANLSDPPPLTIILDQQLKACVQRGICRAGPYLFAGCPLFCNLCSLCWLCFPLEKSGFHVSHR